jgi:hypothetical protein
MILCYVVTFSMVGFAFNLVGMSFGWNVRNQGRLLGLITMPVQLVTSYICFRFLARELAAKAVDRALNEKQSQLMAKKEAGADAMSASKSTVTESMQQR